jgi:SsrA-binding protein
MRPQGTKAVATNKQARRNFDVLETFEMGLVLVGSEVKSLRAAHVQIADAFARFEGDELWLHGVHIAPYAQSAAHSGHDPDRKRKLLAHRAELARLRSRVDQERLALPLISLYFKEGTCKAEIGLGRGRTKSDKRQAIAKDDAAREARDAMGRRAKQGEG